MNECRVVNGAEVEKPKISKTGCAEGKRVESPQIQHIDRFRFYGRHRVLSRSSQVRSSTRLLFQRGRRR